MIVKNKVLMYICVFRFRTDVCNSDRTRTYRSVGAGWILACPERSRGIAESAD